MFKHVLLLSQTPVLEFIDTSRPVNETPANGLEVGPLSERLLADDEVVDHQVLISG